MTQEEIEEDVDISDAFVSRLILWNDDVTPFIFVVGVLCNILGCHIGQAEQMALQAHTKGKTTIKEGDIPELKKMKEMFLEVGVTVSIE